MSILISILLMVEVIAAFLLVVVILAQKSKDQGLGMAFGSGMGESLFGSQAGNVLTRMTITLATVFMLTTIVLGILFARTSGTSTGSIMDKADRQVPAAPAAPAPATSPAPLQAPLMPEDTSAPLVAPSEPVTLQMNESGQLTPVEAPADLEAQPAPEESAENVAAEPAAEPAAKPAAEPAAEPTATE